MLAHAGLSSAQICPSWPKLVQVGPTGDPSWFQIGPMLDHVGASWLQVGPMLAPSWFQVGACWPNLAQVGPNWLQADPKCTPSLPMLAHVGTMLAPCWRHDDPSSKVLPRLTKAVTKALPLRLSLSKMSTKALPQALRHNPSSTVSPRLAQVSTKALPLRPGFFQDVHEGSASGVSTRAIFQGVAKACH